MPGRGGDPLGPARRVVFLLGDQAHEDVFPLRVGLPIGEMAVSGGGLDFAAPHFLDGCQIALVDHVA